MPIDRKSVGVVLLAAGVVLAASTAPVFDAGYRLLALALVVVGLAFLVQGLRTMRDVAERQAEAPVRRRE